MNNKNTTNTIQDFYYENKFSPYKLFKVEPNKNINTITDVVNRNKQLKDKLKKELEKESVKNITKHIEDKETTVGGIETGLVVTNNITKNKQYIKFGLSENISTKDNKKDIEIQKSFNKEKKYHLKIKQFFDETLHYTNDDGTSLFTNLTLDKYQPCNDNGDKLDPPIITSTGKCRTDVYDLSADDKVIKNIRNSFYLSIEKCTNYIKPFFINLFGIRDIRNNNLISYQTTNKNDKYNVQIIDWIFKEKTTKITTRYSYDAIHKLLNLYKKKMNDNNHKIYDDIICYREDTTFINESINAIKNQESKEVNKFFLSNIILRANEILIKDYIDNEIDLHILQSAIYMESLIYFGYLLRYKNDIILEELKALVEKVSTANITSDNIYFIKSFYDNVDSILNEVCENICVNDRSKIKNTKTNIIQTYFPTFTNINENISKIEKYNYELITYDIQNSHNYIDTICKRISAVITNNNLYDINKIIINYFTKLKIARHKDAKPIRFILPRIYDAIFPKIGKSKVRQIAEMKQEDREKLQKHIDAIIKTRYKQYEKAVLGTKDSYGNKIKYGVEKIKSYIYKHL